MSGRSSFLSLFERLEGLANRLPAPLQRPILKEITPLKELFLQQRPPCFVLAGDPTVGAAGLFNAIFGAPVAPFTDNEPAPPSPTGWQEFSRGERGVLRILDARRPAGTAPEAALKAEAPDIFLFLASAESTDLEQKAAALEEMVNLAAKHHDARPCALGLIVQSSEGAEAAPSQVEQARVALQNALAARPGLASRLAPAVTVGTFMRFRLDGTFDPDSDRRANVHQLVDTLVAELPNEAKLEMARLSGAREAQEKIAGTLVSSAAAVSGALGAQPIPFADMPFLLAFQVMMVTGIIYVSGRELSVKLATEFLGSIGMNIGAGLVLREGARAAGRAAAKLFLPGLGNAIGGLVAAGGTYAIGRAATAYYIGGVSLPDARALLKREARPDRGIFHLLDRRKRKTSADRA